MFLWCFEIVTNLSMAVAQKEIKASIVQIRLVFGLNYVCLNLLPIIKYEQITCSFDMSAVQGSKITLNPLQKSL